MSNSDNPEWYDLTKYPAHWWAEYRIQDPKNGIVYDVFGMKIIGATLSIDCKSGVMSLNFEPRGDVDQPYLAPVSLTPFKTEDKSKLIISISVKVLLIVD